MYTESQLDSLMAQAERIGADHGRSAGTWVVDGNTSDETKGRILRGIQDGDPEIMDGIRCAPLSGEYAGDYTIGDLAADLDLDDEEWEPELQTEIEDAYVNAYVSAFWAQVEKECAL